ncbi:ABC transporter family substrate-binding protein [Ornithinimicrobium avium]|uniref:ABC transporter family substrate-binding protein n=2 Tax=Ornithinimicrobium avium TaxID=2283195 RepID=A0A345NJ87_9MICO|nr:ABC transporter family substrate-binding protein [Ornithinimicrobium avium]
MAVVAAGALALAGCTSDTGTPDSTTTAGEGGGGTDQGSETSGAEGSDTTEGAGGEESSAKVDLGDVVTNDDTISFSTGSEQYNAYNGDTSATNSTYNATVNAQVNSGFWYWGTDGTVYPNEWFGSYEKTSDDPLTVEYTISDEAVWSDGTPVSANDYLLSWVSTNPEALGGAKGLGFDPVSDMATYVQDTPQAEVDGKTFTLVYADPNPDWEIMVSGALPAHVAAKQSGLEPGELAQAILDGDTDTIKKVSKFWNTGWVFNDYQIKDESIVPSSGPYTLEGAVWEKDLSLGLVPNEDFWGTPPATGNLVFKFAAPETHVQALQNGDINVIEPQATVDTVDQIKNMGDTVALQTGNEMTWEHLDFNFAEGSVFSEDKGGLAAREAFAMCVPRQQIVQNLIQPINPDAVVMNLREVFPFQTEKYNEVLSAAYSGQYDEVDIEGAKAKLADAGVETPVDVRIGYSAPNQRRTDEVTTIKSSCDEAGFNIIDAGDPTFFQSGGPLEVGDWEVALFAWAGSGQIASGRPIYSTDGTQNFGGYSNADVDAAWKTLSTSLDPAVQLEQTKIIEKTLWDTLYGIPVFAHPGVVGYDASIENVRHTAVQTGVSWNAEQWVRAQ